MATASSNEVKRVESNTPGCPGDPVSLYAIYSRHGLLMDRFDVLAVAMACFREWKHTTCVKCSGKIIAMRNEFGEVVNEAGELV